MHRKLTAFIPFFFVLLVPLSLSAQETEVRKTIDDVLKRLGTNDAAGLADYFTNDAILIVARQTEGRWTNTVETAKRWLERMKSNRGASPFEERLSNVRVTIDSGELAYVRADLAVEGEALEVEILGERVPATVGCEPLYDPDNERLRA